MTRSHSRRQTGQAFAPAGQASLGRAARGATGFALAALLAAPILAATGGEAVAQERTIRIQKVTASATHPAQVFSGPITPGGPNTGAWAVGLPLDGSPSDVASRQVTTAQQTVSETPVSGWTLQGFTVKPDPGGAATCDVNEAYAGTSAIVPADSNNYLVCVNNFYGTITRTLRIQKVTDSNFHPAQVFSGPITPGGPNTGAWAVGLPQDGSPSDIAVREVTSDPQTITETPVPGWVLIGFTVKPDPNGTATCDVNESYQGSQGNVPADANDYLVCVKNTYAPPNRTVRIVKVTDTVTHPGGSFPITISPGLAGQPVNLPITLTANALVGAPNTTLADQAQQTVTEGALPLGWTLAGFLVKPDPNGTETCSPLDSYAGVSATLPADANNYVVCVKNTYVEPTRTIRIGKVTATAGHPAQTFTGSITPAAQGWSVNLLFNEVISAAISTHVVGVQPQTITETLPPAGWALRGFFVKPDPNGTESCTLNDPYTGTSAIVPGDQNNYLVCVCNDYSLLPGSRTVRVEKVVGAPGGNHPGGTFDLIAQPGPGTLQVVIPADGVGPFPTISSMGQMTLSTLQHSLTEIPLPEPWLRVGYAVIPDPLGTAVCTGNETYAGTSAHIPADYNDYLVCVRNDYGRRLRIEKITGSATHPAQGFNYQVLPGFLAPLTPSDSLALDAPAGAGGAVVVSGASQQVIELPGLPLPWGPVGYVVKTDPAGTAACDLNDAWGASATVPAGAVPYLVCVRNDFGRALRFQKVTPTAAHPGGAFLVDVAPGALGPTADTVPLSLAPNAPDSGPAVTVLVQLAALSLTEAMPIAPAGWGHIGFAVKPDPLGTAVCDVGTDVFVPQPVGIPAGTTPYLVCVRNDWVAPPPATRTVRIGKVTTSAFHPGSAFGGIVYSNMPFPPPLSWGTGLAPSQPSGPIVSVAVPSNYTATVTEEPVPALWVLVGFLLQADPNGTAVCDPQAQYSGSAQPIPADTNSYLVCIRNDYVPVDRLVRVEKVAPVAHPGGSFSVLITPGAMFGPQVQSLALPPNTTGAPFGPLFPVSTAAQLVNEFFLPFGWSVVGYNVQVDSPPGTALCDPQGAYLPGPVAIPADTNHYLVCVKNEYGRPLRIEKVTQTTTHPGGTFPIAVYVNPDGSGTPILSTSLVLDPNAAVSDPVPPVIIPPVGVSLGEYNVPAPWGVAGYLVKPDPLGTETCSATEPGYVEGGGQVPPGTGQYLVCIRNEYSRRLRIQKVAEYTSTNPQIFDVTVIAGHPTATNPVVQLTLAANATSSSDQSVLLDFNAQTVFETPAPYPWHTTGYTIKPDPAGTATCAVNETYAGGHIHVPAGFASYLVCIKNDYNPPAVGHTMRTVRVIKVTDAQAHPGAAFSGTAVPGGPNTNSFAVSLDPNANVSAPVVLTLTSTTQRLEETTLPQYWSVVGYVVKPDPNGTETCALNDPYLGTEVYVPGDAGNYLVCIKNAFNPLPRTVRVQKTTLTPNHPPVVFDGTIAPGVPDTTYQVTLGIFGIFSSIDSRTVASYQSHTVTETPVPLDWTLDGYLVIPDPSGTATCTLGGPVLGTATIPPDDQDYLVCVQNTYTGLPVVP